ncbi:VC0807 family protein [Pseudonocardia xinjiangensis]|uniref:VC0807 family protein n=1 Tax=Pseudonocardia xinjiangensis TaxID=75289 RepID=UPI003D8C02E5
MPNTSRTDAGTGVAVPVDQNTDDPRPNPTLVMVRGLAWDVGLPVAAYYALHLAGATDWVALLAASGIAAARTVWGAVRHRTLNQFAVLMLLVYGIGLLLAFVSGDPKALLLKSSLVTAAVGAVFLVTAILGGRPLTLAAAQSFLPARAEALSERYRSEPHVRRGFRLTSAVWGVGLLAEAVLRIPLVVLLPVDIGVGASEGLFVATFVALMVWNGWYIGRVLAAPA